MIDTDREFAGIEVTAKAGTHPIHPMLVPFPIGLLIACFVCDLAYWATGAGFWAEAAFWSLLAGIVMAAVAALAGVTDFLGNAEIRALRPAWEHMIGNVSAVVLPLISLWIRIASGHEEAALPFGLILSAIVALLLVYTGWKGGELVYNHRVGVNPAKPALRR